MDEFNHPKAEHPGIQLAAMRQQKGYTIEYVASKLHLRVHIIERLEKGDFSLLPEPVFIKGYLRAYAKLLGIAPDPFLEVYNEQYCFEKKTERALWQSKKQSHKAEHFIRWFTLLFAVTVLIVVGLWWHNNRDAEPVLTTEKENHSNNLSLKKTENREHQDMADISQLESLLMPTPQMTPLEEKVINKS